MKDEFIEFQLKQIDAFEKEIEESKEHIRNCKYQIELYNSKLDDYIKDNSHLLRPMEDKDLYEGNRYFLIGDDKNYYTGKMQEIYRIEGDYKNYCGEDGCVHSKCYSLVLKEDVLNDEIS